MTSYQKRLLVFLSVATFFEGYDFIALTQLLPNLRDDFGLSKAWSGYILGAVNIGTMAAYFVLRRADGWGRRRTLTLTIAGYTICTFLSGLAPNVFVFAALQLVARTFLIAEWALSAVVAAEEFDAARRGTVIGIIQASSSLGMIFCAGVVPLLLSTPYGWRTVYFVGLVPLLLLAYARRDLRETRRFEQDVGVDVPRPDLLRIWRSPYRKRMLQLAAIWFFSYIASQNVISFWKEFAVGERGFTDAEVGIAVSIAAVAALPAMLLIGPLIDAIGRRRGAIVLYTIAGLGTLTAYNLEGRWPLTLGLVLGMAGASAHLPLLNTYNSELFPTHLRADAFGWANNLLGRMGYVASPLFVGLLAEHYGVFGPVVSMTAIFPLVALALVWRWLPETRNRSLEETIQLEDPAN